MTKKHWKWCTVCEGTGGWDKRNYKARFRSSSDNNETYMSCIWCGDSNVITKVVVRI